MHPVFMRLSNGLGVTSAARQQLKIGLIFGTLLWPSASLSSPLLPSQDQPTFFNVRICRDRQVLSALKAAASSTRKANVTIAHGKGPKWSGYDPNDIHLEAVSLSPDEEFSLLFGHHFGKRDFERIVYVIGATPDSWVVRFGGSSGTGMGGHKLFPEGPIIIEPKGIPGAQ